MAFRLLSRSKTQSVARLLLQPSASSGLVGAAQCLRGIGSLASRPLSDLGSAPSRSDRCAPVSSGFASAPVLGHLGPGKIFGYEKILPNCTFSALHGNAQNLARSLHVKGQGGAMDPQCDNLHSIHSNVRRAVGVEKNNCLKGKENDCSKIIAFSPLEGTLAGPRKSELLKESLKVKRMELSIKTTYALVPLLLLISKTKLTTSMLVMCIYWQVYGFFKEIFLDYVHHEVTRKWVLIYFKLLLFILAKDTILAFDLV